MTTGHWIIEIAVIDSAHGDKGSEQLKQYKVLRFHGVENILLFIHSKVRESYYKMTSMVLRQYREDTNEVIKHERESYLWTQIR